MKKKSCNMQKHSDITNVIRRILRGHKRILTPYSPNYTARTNKGVKQPVSSLKIDLQKYSRFAAPYSPLFR